MIDDLELRHQIVRYHSYRAAAARQLRDGREGLGLVTVPPTYAALLPPQLFAVGSASVSSLPDSALASVRPEQLLASNPEVRRYIQAASVYQGMVELVLMGNLRDRSQERLAPLPEPRVP